jgi:hypothetical protein
MAGVFQNIYPPSPSPPGGGRTHSRGGEGGQYFARRQTQLYTLRMYISTCGLERLEVNIKVATVLGSILAFSDTVISKKFAAKVANKVANQQD